ncbi:MAG TPA: hypothetical protein VI260_23060, partial [Blastocatellia bacterium]
MKEVLRIREGGRRKSPDPKDGGEHRQFSRRAPRAYRIDLRSQPCVEIRDVFQRRIATGCQTREGYGGGDNHCGYHHHDEEGDGLSERETDLDFNCAGGSKRRQRQ